jgi:hypothetical protein
MRRSFLSTFPTHAGCFWRKDMMAIDVDLMKKYHLLNDTVSYSKKLPVGHSPAGQ